MLRHLIRGYDRRRVSDIKNITANLNRGCGRRRKSHFFNFDSSACSAWHLSLAITINHFSGLELISAPNLMSGPKRVISEGLTMVENSIASWL